MFGFMLLIFIFFLIFLVIIIYNQNLKIDKSQDEFLPRSGYRQ